MGEIIEHNDEVPAILSDDYNDEVPVNNMADLSKFIDRIQRAEEIKSVIERSTAERAAMVQEMLKEKEKSPSLIKSIIERLNGS